MAVQTQRMTVEEFDEFVGRPEHADRLFEYIGGEVVEVVSSQRSSAIAYNVGFFIKFHLRTNNIAGLVTGADGGYEVAGERYIPAVAFVSTARQSEPSGRAYSPIPPDLAVEVLSPSSTPHEMRLQVVNYLAAGTTVWIVDPDRPLVEVYAPGHPGRTVRLDGTLDGGDVLPGFRLSVQDIFAS